MAYELLTPTEMAEVDRLSIETGPFDGMGLMRRAAAAVAALVLERFPAARVVEVLCGPGNNGGDGYVVAKLLHESGMAVRLWTLGEPPPRTDAATAAAECPITAELLTGFRAEAGSVVVDALFGAGLVRPVEGVVATVIAACLAAGLPVVAIDLPSGVSGDTGATLGSAFKAELTVTFFRKKPGHLLLPGRALCGELIVADIGIRADVLDAIGPACFENGPALWGTHFPHVAANVHKYSRGHVGVFSGGPASTGAARLSAYAAARAGAGAVTMLSPGDALQVNAAHLTSIMLRKVDTLAEAASWLGERKPAALIFGPGLGLQDSISDFGLDVIGAATGLVGHMVFDADGLTHLARRRDAFIEAFGKPGAPQFLLTPHDGEFARVFPEIAADSSMSKVERARQAALKAGVTMILKGADTVIASRDGRAAINTNAAPWLATAGSGDVLAGVTASLLAQGMPPFEAACAAVWLHGEAGSRFGPGLIAEDLPDLLPPLLRDLMVGTLTDQGG